MLKDIFRSARESRRHPLPKPTGLTREEALAAAMAPAIISEAERGLALLPKQTEDFYRNLGEAPVSTIAYSPTEGTRVRRVTILTVPGSRAGVRLDRRARPVFCPDPEGQAEKEGIVILPARNSAPIERRPGKLLEQLASATTATDPECRRKILDQVKAEIKERHKKIANTRIYASAYEALTIIFGASAFIALKEGVTFGRVTVSVATSAMLAVAAASLDDATCQTICSPRETKRLSRGYGRTIRALEEGEVYLSPRTRFFP